MSEYEDRYPEAYGRHEEIEKRPAQRRFFGFPLSRQVRDPEPAVAEARRDAPQIVNIQQEDARSADVRPADRHARQVERMHERARRPLVQRTPQAISDDVAEQLATSSFIDATGILITVDGSEVTLSGTINSLIAISLAKALTSNVPGVGRVQVQLRVQPVPRSYEWVGSQYQRVE